MKNLSSPRDTSRLPNAASAAKLLRALTLCLATLVSQIAFAQTQVVSNSTIPVASSGSSRYEARERQFEALANQAIFVEQQYSLIKNVVKTVRPTVVHIEAKKTSKQNPNETPAKSSYIEEAGSGIIIEHGGRHYIVTNYHVIENSEIDEIRIEADGQWFFPTRVVHDRESDLSVLFVDRDDLQAVRFGQSDKVEIGDFVIAVGSPFGLSHSVSYGIISAMGRRDLELGPQGVRYQNFLQTDAAINPGNSGGPLINLRGEVIGINTAIASNSGGSDGIGFSIPIDMAARVAADLIDFGRVQRGFLGVSLDARFSPRRAISMGLQRAYGARVSAITPGSPADKADIEIGDIVLEFNGMQIMNDSHLVTEVSMTPIGKDVPMKIYREGEILTISIAVENRESFATTVQN